MRIYKETQGAAGQEPQKPLKAQKLLERAQSSSPPNQPVYEPPPSATLQPPRGKKSHKKAFFLG